jgi:hypothetical protein
VEVIGKQLSNDAQSQFLSAATDNAKELILGGLDLINLLTYHDGNDASWL